MITRDNQYEGFTTTERMTADKIVSFLDDFSFRIRKNTFVVFDNATVHRNRWISEEEKWTYVHGHLNLFGKNRSLMNSMIFINELDDFH